MGGEDDRDGFGAKHVQLEQFGQGIAVLAVFNEKNGEKGPGLFKGTRIDVRSENTTRNDVRVFQSGSAMNHPGGGD